MPWLICNNTMDIIVTLVRLRVNKTVQVFAELTKLVFNFKLINQIYPEAHRQLVVLVAFATRAMRLEPLPTKPNFGKRRDWMSPKALLVMFALMVGLAMKFTHTWTPNWPPISKSSRKVLDLSSKKGKAARDPPIRPRVMMRSFESDIVLHWFNKLLYKVVMVVLSHWKVVWNWHCILRTFGNMIDLGQSNKLAF